MAKDRNSGKPRSRGGKASPRRARKKLMPYELLLKVARGETIDGQVPTIAQRLAAAKQALPYYKPRLAPQRTEKQEEPLTVRLIRFSELDPAEQAEQSPERPR